LFKFPDYLFTSIKRSFILLENVERFIGNALDVSLGVWHFATKGIILLKSFFFWLNMPAVVNAKLRQRTLRSHWSIPFTQERLG
jgi:hypothetical protein